MRTFILLLLCTMGLFAQSFTEIFFNDLPVKLKNENELLETQLRINLQTCEKINPLLAGYYIEYLIARFDNNENSPDKNYFSTFNQKLETARKNRNDFVEAAGNWFYKHNEGEYNIYGKDLVSKLKVDYKTIGNDLTEQKIDKNKLYYYGYKLLSRDMELFYDKDTDYGAMYANFLKPGVEFINELPAERSMMADSQSEYLEETLVSRLFIVKGSNEETGGLKTKRNLFELMLLVGNDQISEKISLFVTAGFIPFNNEINKVLETLVEYRGEMGSLTNEKSFDLKYSIFAGAGIRYPLKRQRGIFSYIDISAGILQGFKSEVSEIREFTFQLPYEVDYSEYFYSSYDSDFYELVENNEINVSGFFVGFATPLFSKDRTIDVGLSLDVHYINYEYEQIYLRTLLKEFATKTISVYDDHTSSISESVIFIQPGLWTSLRFFNLVELNVKYLAPAGLKASVSVIYNL